MSRFLTRKYLKYSTVDAKVIDDDVACRSCGYNLRGLSSTGSCPECGGAIESASALRDLLGQGDIGLRQRMQLGLALASLCLVIVILNRLWLFVSIVPGLGGPSPRRYLIVGGANVIVWVIAALLLTPVELTRHWAWMRWPRLIVMLTQPAWILAYSMWVVDVFKPSAPMWTAGGQLLLRFIAGIGAVVLAWILAFLASEAELGIVHKRLNTAVWMLPLAALPPLLFIGAIPWFAVVPLGIFLAFWFWGLFCFMRGTWALHQYTRWSLRHGAESRDRDRRVRERRAELDAEVAARVRPMPKD